MGILARPIDNPGSRHVPTRHRRQDVARTRTRTSPAPYKDPDLPLDEFCACTKRLWSLTEFNVQKHLFGEKSGGGCPDYKKRRFEIQQGQDPNIKKKKQLKLFDRVRLSYSIFARLRDAEVDRLDRLDVAVLQAPQASSSSARAPSSSSTPSPITRHKRTTHPLAPAHHQTLFSAWNPVVVAYVC